MLTRLLVARLKVVPFPIQCDLRLGPFPNLCFAVEERPFEGRVRRTKSARALAPGPAILGALVRGSYAARWSLPL
jgi:hypothetical protein